MTSFRHMLCGAFLLTAAPIAAQTAFEDIGALDERVAAALGAPIGAPGGAVAPIDRRLRLAACPQPAALSAPLAGAVTVRCPAIGWRIRVAVGAPTLASQGVGSPSSSAVEPPLVRRGETVDLIIAARGFSVTGSGTAEQSGRAGDRIRVRLASGNRVATGRIVADGRVAIAGLN